MTASPPAPAATGRNLAHLLQVGMAAGLQQALDSHGVESLYALGYLCYGQGRYEDARRAFTFITVQRPLDQRSRKALGATLQMMGRHDEALRTHAAASLLDATDPEPPVRMAECLVALGRLAQARHALEFAAAALGRRPQAVLQARVDLLNNTVAAAPAAASGSTAS